MLRTTVKRLARTFADRRYVPLNLITLNRTRVLHNLGLLQSAHPDFQVIPVLKGNAYGHGLEEMATILRDAPCDFVAVDGYFEASKVRHILKQRILVMGYILPQNVRLLDTKRCSFVVQDMQGLEALANLRRPVRVHLELNTGMNRLGLSETGLDEYLHTLKTYPQLQLEGVMTHLADADNEIDETFTQRQIALFDTLVARILEQGFTPTLIHIAQTAGSTKVSSKYANAMRLGIGLYGINPLAPTDAQHRQLDQLQPVLELRSTIIKVLHLQKGDRVSYNGTFTAQKPMRVGVLPLGYYEGVQRELSGKGCATDKGVPLPILGRVCMDHIMIDLGTANLTVGDVVTVISNNPTHPNSVAGIGKAHGLFAYTLLTGLSSSIRRRIV